MEITVDTDAAKVFRFRPNYNQEAALQQAEKNKLDAFGLLVKMKFWDKPKDEEFVVSRGNFQYEPFWHCLAQRRCQYTKREQYTVKAKSPSAMKVEVRDKTIPVVQGAFVVEAVEHCWHTNKFDQFFPGLNRQEKSLDGYRKKFVNMIEPVETGATFDTSVYVEPQQRASLIIQTAVKNITIPFDADTVIEDVIDVTALHLYYRPVYNFEFTWATKGGSGVIQIDGLTGDVVAQADTHIQDIAGRRITREHLFDVGGDVAGMLIPGGKTIIKVIDILTRDVEDDANKGAA